MSCRYCPRCRQPMDHLLEGNDLTGIRTKVCTRCGHAETGTGIVFNIIETAAQYRATQPDPMTVMLDQARALLRDS